MTKEFRVRSFRIEDEVWEAVRAHPLSANRLLRVALGMGSGVDSAATGFVIAEKVFRPDETKVTRYEIEPMTCLDAVSENRGKASVETWRRGPRQKGDKTR